MIEAVNAQNLDEVLPLIRQYQEFYQVTNISDEHNRSFFSRFGLDDPFGCLFLYRGDDGTAIGFATAYFCFSSTAAAKVGILNDLFTLPGHRGRGIGKALIVHCHDYVRRHGAIRLQWTTATDNTTAQRLYNALNTAHKPWLIYTYQGENPA
ncbi:ribosomal protein S18 acetylase RimI-like enzyme [Fluviicoccus keumensis]|uniref:Ribosomal protein S18 acetylase RimI-like enzyme n=1 Tax=Fluviicoccus keumensis TaxID=1435465 RepID=A0A4Q7Z3Z3_9GAMM|nr:GNAT family N-acetyltransferase [Fluviicoccus keumensis]RZU44958.1 ribosomal protein S18 acetylase RimI-like enzyme [Fluviicoccus keumensis]